MKKYLLAISCSCSIACFSQNVGIGTVTPSERLHVTQTADFDKNVIYGYANQSPVLADYQNTGVAGLGQGNGTAGVLGYGYGFGIKGIGSTNGYGAVGVYAALGTFIPSVALSNNYYALYADVRTAAANRYAGVFLNGNVGIGTTAPEYILDVADRMRLRSGPGGTAGLWLNKTDNSAPTGFIGNIDDNNIGIYGNNSGAWSFSVNTSNGNVGIGNVTPANKLDVSGNLNFTGFLKLNGAVGALGQVLQSSGVGGPPTWVSPTKSMYDNSGILTQVSSVTSTSGSPVNYFPDLIYTFTANGPTKAQISFAANIVGISCGACSTSKAAINITVDGSQNCTYHNPNIFNANNGEFPTTISGTYLQQVGFGSHTIRLQLVWEGGPSIAAYAPNSSNYLSVVLFPQ
ncbi:MAG: hypothetical protein ABIY51_08135 [Ferruginibacter sp.]